MQNTELTVTLQIPEQLGMLSQLLNFKIEYLLQGFIHDVSADINSTGGTERLTAAEYFLTRNFSDYTNEDVTEMLNELNFIRAESYNCPEDEYQDLRKQYLERWFKDWKNKADISEISESNNPSKKTSPNP
jgi:hypothetical protein